MLLVVNLPLGNKLLWNCNNFSCQYCLSLMCWEHFLKYILLSFRHLTSDKLFQRNHERYRIRHWQNTHMFCHFNGSSSHAICREMREAMKVVDLTAFNPGDWLAVCFSTSVLINMVVWGCTPPTMIQGTGRNDDGIKHPLALSCHYIFQQESRFLENPMKWPCKPKTEPHSMVSDMS